jgi:hypothetical protein
MTVTNLNDKGVGLTGVAAASAIGTLTPWVTYHYAREWYEDAVREAGQPGYASRRREILFAVCAAESYILEWVRDVVLNQDFPKLLEYFPVGLRRGVCDKFRQIPKQLVDDGRLPARLDCGGREFAAFNDLVDYRDGLVHASASRPQTTAWPPDQQPIPTRGELVDMTPGWAVGVVRALIMKLHLDTNTPLPDWMK